MNYTQQPYQIPSHHSDYSWLIYLVAGAFVGLTVLVRAIQLRRARAMDDGPVMASDDMLGSVGGLQSMARGTVVGFSYNLLTNNSGRVMFLVELGHNSWSHILAYGDKSGLRTMFTTPGKWLEPAALEGNFPDYFRMLCNPEAQAALRVLFTPDIMALFVDFCRSYDLELFHDTLYITKAKDAIDTDDQTTLVTDVTTFLQKTGPSLQRLEP
jgi:hypothetical protein